MEIHNNANVISSKRSTTGSGGAGDIQMAPPPPNNLNPGSSDAGDVIFHCSHVAIAVPIHRSVIVQVFVSGCKSKSCSLLGIGNTQQCQCYLQSTLDHKVKRCRGHTNGTASSKQLEPRVKRCLRCHIPLFTRRYRCPRAQECNSSCFSYAFCSTNGLEHLQIGCVHYTLGNAIDGCC